MKRSTIAIGVGVVAVLGLLATWGYLSCTSANEALLSELASRLARGYHFRYGVWPQSFQQAYMEANRPIQLDLDRYAERSGATVELTPRADGDGVLVKITTAYQIRQHDLVVRCEDHNGCENFAAALLQPGAARDAAVVSLSNTLETVAILLQEFYWQHGRLPHSYEEVRVRALHQKSTSPVLASTKYSWSLYSSGGANDKDPYLHDIVVRGKLADGRVDIRRFEIRLEDPNHVWRSYSFLDPTTGKMKLATSSENLADTIAAMIVFYVHDHRTPPRDFQSLSYLEWFDEIAANGGSARFSFSFVREGNVGEILVMDNDEQIRYSYPWRPVKARWDFPNRIGVPRVDRLRRPGGSE